MAAAAMGRQAAEMVAVDGVGGGGGGERKRKKTLGRQKIEIKRINCIEARHVCFSKRRAGLFKKASQLSVLTGAHLAVVVFSPADKPYSIGHSSVNAVLDRYYYGDPAAASYVPPPTADEAAAEVAALSAVAQEHEAERESLEEAIKAEARRRVALDAAAAAAAAAGAWNVVDGDLRGARMPELLAMLAALERVQAEAVQRTREIVAEDAIMQQYAAAGAGAGAGDGDGFQLQYPYPGAAGSFAADGSHLEAMDTRMMLMGGGDVSHALPFAPMMLPADLPPQPPVLPQAFNYGYEDNHFAGYGGYGYDLLGDGGSGHGAAYEMKGLAGDGGMEGYCYETATTCNFFG